MPDQPRAGNGEVGEEAMTAEQGHHSAPKTDSAGDGLSGEPGPSDSGADLDGSTIATPAGKGRAGHQQDGDDVNERVERIEAERDAALAVAASSFREALTEQVYDNGAPIGSLAELAHVEVTEETPNFRIQADIADELRRWWVPPEHRPTCPSGRPCTSWTCLVDECVLNGEELRA